MIKEFPLTSLYFYISGDCNLDCRHCWIDPHPIKEELDLNEIKALISQMEELGAKNIKITGGEPFVKKDIFKILGFLSQRKINIVIETNGTLIREKEAGFLKDIGVKFISISLDSTEPEIHNSFRNHPEAFDLTRKGLEALTKAGFRPQIITSLCRENKDDIEKMAIFAKKNKAGTLKLNPIMPISRAEELNNQGRLLGISELLEIERFIEEKLQPKIDIPILLDIPPAFKRLGYLKKRSCSCNILNIIGVLADGTVSICGIGTKIEELNFGNIRTTPLAVIWKNNPFLRSLREIIPHGLEGVCGECMFRSMCKGKCRAMAYYQNKSLSAPFDFCQKAFEAGVFPEKRLIRGGKQCLSRK